VKNVAYKAVGHWFLAAYAESPPTEDEAREILRVFKSLDLDRMRTIVVTRGGAPTAAQRKELNEVLKGRVFPAAVVSDNIMVRGVVTAMSWFNSAIKVFSLSAIDDAMRYVGVPETHFVIVRSELVKLQAAVAKPRTNRAFD
jgi:hypothetical protein